MASLISKKSAFTYVTLLVAVLTISKPSIAEHHVSTQSDHSADQSAITAHGQLWKQLYEAGQIDEMHVLYEPDAWLMTHGAPAAKGVDAILNYLKRTKKAGNKVVFDFTPEDITIEGNKGYLISKYWMTVTTAENKTFDAMGRSFLVFKKGPEGKWRLWRDMDNQAPDVLASERSAH